MDPDSTEYEEAKLDLNFLNIQEDICPDLDEAIGNEVKAKIKSEEWKNESTGSSGVSTKIEKFII